MPEGSTKKRRSEDRSQAGGSGSSSSFRPRVHPIIPEPKSDSRRDKKTAGGSKVHSSNIKPEDPKDIKIDPEQLKALDIEQAQQDEEMFTNPVDDYVRQDLAIEEPEKIDPSRPIAKEEPQRRFRPTIGKPGSSTDKQSGTSSSPSSKEKSSSATNEPIEEADALKNYLNDVRANHLEKLSSKEKGKKSAFGKFNFVGRGKSKLKIAIIGAVTAAFVAGAVAIVGVLPSAIESILTGSTTSYSNFSTEAIVKRVFNDYFKESVLLPECRNGAQSGGNCNFSPSSNSRLWRRAMDDMRANKMDEKLRAKGIQWHHDGNGQFTFFISKDGKPLDSFAQRIDFNSFDAFEMGENEGSKFLDSLVKDEINNTSRWKKYFIRGPTLRAMRTRTGSTGCFFLCKAKDSFNKTKKWPKRAFGRFVKQHVLWPSSGLLKYIVDCMISGGDSCTARSFHTFIKGKILEAASKLFNEEFAQKILKEFDEALSKGVTRYILEAALKRLMEWLTGQASSVAAGNIAGAILFLYAFGKLANTLKTKLPRILRIKNLMTVAAASATFMIIINEMRRGTTPLPDFGAMLSTFIGMGGSRMFASIFMGPDNKTAQNGQPYTCNNKEDGGFAGAVSDFITPATIQPGELTCNSFKFDYTPTILDNPLIGAASNIYEKISTACVVKGVCADTIVDKIQQYMGTVMGWISGWLSYIPGYEKITGFLTAHIESFGSALLGALTPTIVTDAFSGVVPGIAPQGARVFDALSGGASGINQYLTPRDELGGGKLNLAAQLDLDNAIAKEQAQDTHFASRYNRFFNLDPTVGPGPSLLAQLSASTPANYSMASFLNPMKNLSLAFTSASNQHTYASSSSNASLIARGFATPVRGHPLSVPEGIAKGTREVKDPESAECKKEVATWKKQIEERTDASEESGLADTFGFGIPDGTSECLLADTSLKVLTTHRSTTDDFPYEGSSSDGETGGGGSGGGGGGGGTDPAPTEGALGKCEGVEVTRPNAGKPNDYEMQLVPGTNITVMAIYCTNVKNLVDAAAADGLDFSRVYSSFRTYEDQVRLRRQNCAGKDETDNYIVYEKSPSACKPPTAKPGESNHNKGTAIDFANCHHGSACFNWLKANAARFGYKNLPSESWHWSVTGG